MADYQEVSPKDKLRIATHYMLNAPNGEIDDVIRDVTKLVGDDKILSKAQIEGILREYNSDQMVFAPSPDNPDRNIMVCQQAKIKPDVFFDPETDQVFRFDNFARNWSSEKGKGPSVPSNIESYRFAIQESLKEYTDTVYMDPKKYCLAVFAQSNGDVTIHISAKNISLPNFWSGGWRTTFTVNVSSEGRADISGLIKINVHYFEDGNVQLTTNFNRTESIKIETPELTSKSVYAAIDTIETQFQADLEEFYADMHKYSFAAMRRFLPVTRNPMDWNPNAHKLASQLKE